MRKSVIEKYKGKSFAEASQMIEKRYPDRNTNTISQRSYLAEIGALMQHQESVKATTAQPPKMAKGGVIPGLPIQPPAPVARETTSTVQPRPFDDLIFKQKPNQTPSNGDRFLSWMTGSTDTMNKSYQNLNRGIDSYNQQLKAEGLEGQTSLSVYNRSPQKMAYGGIPAMTIYQGLQAATGDMEKGLYKKLGVDTGFNPKDKQKPLVPTPTTNGPSRFGSFMKDNIYAPVAVGKGFEFLAKAGMVAGGYDQVDPQLNPFEGEIRSTMQSRGIGLDSVRSDVASMVNTAIAQSGNTRSQAVRQGLVQNAASSGMQQLANVGVQQQQMNNQYKAETANTLNSLGQQEVQARNYAEQLNNQSKAGYQTSVQNLVESIGGAGQELTNFRAGIAQQQLLADTMRTTNFQMGNARTLIMNAVNGKRMDIDTAIEIVQNSGGKTQAQIEQEIAAAEQRMQQAVTKTN